MYIGDSWYELKSDLIGKFKRSVANPALIFYSIAAILIIGNLSFWIEVLKYCSVKNTSPSIAAMVNSLITFFPAVAVPACMQLNIANTDKKSAKSLSLLIAIMIALAALLISIIPQTLDSVWLLGTAIILTVISYIIWLGVNADNPDFSDPDPEVPIGGSVDTKMSGSLEGIKS